MSKIEPHVIAVGFQSTKELLSLIETKTSDLVSLSHFPFLFGNHINNSKAQVLLSAHGTLERGQFNLGNYIICFVIFAIFCLFLDSLLVQYTIQSKSK